MKNPNRTSPTRSIARLRRLKNILLIREVAAVAATWVNVKAKVIFPTLVLLLGSRFLLAASDPLPSWNDTATKKSIVDFVARVTAEGSADFVPPTDRIATFDNDGTLWAEQPMYVQMTFALDRVQNS